MGRFGFDDADNYGNNSSGSFFSLKNDGDVARVRFVYRNMDDVEGYAVHEVEVNGKKRYVNCLRDYNEPKSKCPFCDDNRPQRAKLYIPVFDVDEGELKIWERGKNFFPKISSLCARYSSADSPLAAQIFDVERHGKKGDTNTTYEIFPVEKDDTTLEDLPEVPEIIGGIVLDKTADDMRYYLENGCFPNNDGAPVRHHESADEPVRRRTPSRNSEAF